MNIEMYEKVVPISKDLNLGPPACCADAEPLI